MLGSLSLKLSLLSKIIVVADVMVRAVVRVRGEEGESHAYSGHFGPNKSALGMFYEQ